MPAATDGATDIGAARRGGGSLWADAWHDLVRNPVFVVSSLVVLVVVSWAAFPGLWTDIQPTGAGCDLKAARQPPGDGNIFGTTVLGCDMYTHIIYGARPSIVIAVVVTVATAIIGGLLGITAGYFGGWLDTVISRMTDIFLGLPFILGALIFLALLQSQNKTTVSLVLIALGWTTMARIVRGTVISLRNQDFVEAARAMGASNGWIIRRHILPNALGPVIIAGTIDVAAAIIAESTLSFLGLGFPPDVPTWGRLLFDAKDFLDIAAHWALFPGGAIFVAVVAINFIGDGMRDALDARRVI
jgi:peptide/nickel transport system permease protein/oligopeptide transport system permease protein